MKPLIFATSLSQTWKILCFLVKILLLYDSSQQYIQKNVSLKSMKSSYKYQTLQIHCFLAKELGMYVSSQ